MKSATRFARGLVVAALTLIPTLCAAQTQRSPHGYVVGLGGMTATDVASPFFGASAGFTVAPHLQITADIGRMKDIEAPFTRTDLSLLDQGVNANSYGPYTPVLASSVKIPTNYVTGGVRMPFFLGNLARPYVAVSAGVAHMSPSPSFRYTYAYTGATEDITADVMSTQRSAACAWLTSAACVPNAFREDTRPMVGVGAGVAFVMAQHLTFDVGYKYSGIFIQTDYLQDRQGSPDSHTRIDTHRLFAGVGVAF